MTSYVERGRIQAATLTQAASRQLDAASAYLLNTDASRIGTDLETFARNRVPLTAALGLLGGFIGARTLRAIGSRLRYHHTIEEYHAEFVR